MLGMLILGLNMQKKKNPENFRSLGFIIIMICNDIAYVLKISSENI